MKWFVFLAAAFSAAAGGLDGIKTVYLLPMSNGLDQYLAIRLTTGAVLQVVADPQKADAILTDHIGPSLEQKLDELYGPKQKPASEEDLMAPAKPIAQAISRAKGAVFLVDRKTHNVLWSDYEHPRNTTPGEMNHIAEKISGKLFKDVKSN